MFALPQKDVGIPEHMRSQQSLQQMLADTQDKFQLAQYRFVLGVATAIVHLCKLMTSGKDTNLLCIQQSLYAQLAHMQDMQLYTAKLTV